MSYPSGAFDGYTSGTVNSIAAQSTYTTPLPATFTGKGYAPAVAADGYAYNLRWDMTVSPLVGSPSPWSGSVAFTITWRHRLFEPSTEGGLVLLDQTVTQEVSINAVGTDGSGNVVISDYDFTETVSTATVDGATVSGSMVDLQDNGVTQTSDGDGLVQSASTAALVRYRRNWQSAPLRLHWEAGSAIALMQTDYSVSPAFDSAVGYDNGDWRVQLRFPTTRSGSDWIVWPAGVQVYSSAAETTLSGITGGVQYATSGSTRGVTETAHGVFDAGSMNYGAITQVDAYVADNESVLLVRNFMGEGPTVPITTNGTITGVRRPVMAHDLQRGGFYVIAEVNATGAWHLYRSLDWLRNVTDMGEVFSNDYKRPCPPVVLADGRLMFAAVKRGTLECYCKTVAFDGATMETQADTDAVLIAEVTTNTSGGFLLRKPQRAEVYFSDGYGVNYVSYDYGRTWEAVS